MRRTSSTVIMSRILVGRSDTEILNSWTGLRLFALRPSASPTCCEGTSPRGTFCRRLLGLCLRNVTFGVAVGGDAVDEQSKPEREPGARVLREHGLFVRQVRTSGVPLEPYLLSGGNPSNEVHTGGGAQF